MIELARDNLNPDLEWLGVVLNIADMRTVHSREALESLQEHFGDKVFDTVIRQSIAYAESAERAISILDYRPDLGADYLALADELLRRLSRPELLEPLDELSHRARPRGGRPLVRWWPIRRAAFGARSGAVGAARGGGRTYLADATRRPGLAAGFRRSARRSIDGPLPEQGAGASAAVAELARLGRDGGNPLERAALLSLRHRRHARRRRWPPTGSPRATTRSPSAGPPLRSPSRPRAGRGPRGCASCSSSPPTLAGVLVSGATMANFTGLIGSATAGAASEHGVDVDEAGMSGAPAPRILDQRLRAPERGRRRSACSGSAAPDVSRLARRRRRAPRPRRARARAARRPSRAIVIANAGEVNAGDFDPIAAMAELTRDASTPGCTSTGPSASSPASPPRSRALTDGHRARRLDHRRRAQVAQRPLRLRVRLRPRARARWRRPSTSARRTCRRPTTRARTPASWRRRTRAARGRSRSGRRCAPTGATATGRWSSATCASPATSPTAIDAAPELERLAEVPLNIVCFRAPPRGVAGGELDALNRELGRGAARDGRVYSGTDRLRRQGRLPAGDRQLADDRGRRRGLVEMLSANYSRRKGERATDRPAALEAGDHPLQRRLERPRPRRDHGDARARHGVREPHRARARRGRGRARATSARSSRPGPTSASRPPHLRPRRAGGPGVDGDARRTRARCAAATWSRSRPARR